MTAAGDTAQGIQQPYTVTNAAGPLPEEVTLPEEVSKIVLADWYDTGKHRNTEVCIVGL